jgi:hypothetical protein
VQNRAGGWIVFCLTPVAPPSEVSRADLILVALALCLLGAAPPTADGPDPEPPARERRIEGVWALEEQFGNGWPSPSGIRMEFTPSGKYYFLGERGGRGGALKYRLSPRKRPAEIDVEFSGPGVLSGIYKTVVSK